MSMPICQHCNKQWTYGESLKNLFFLKCPYCQERNYARKFRARDIAFGVAMPIIILFLLPLTSLSFGWRTIIVLCALTVYIATYPIKLQLTKEEEPIF